jgi:predicted acetylornithine/succinylornithine family transaminase
MNDALLANYNRAPVTFVRGEGCWLFDDTGRRYLDCIAGIAVCSLGHAHPEIADAISEQAHTLVHVSNLYYAEPTGRLARELVTRSGLGRAFFCNSGAEANEAAIKLARKRAFRLEQTQRRTILSCSGSFHGRTMGALAATANEHYHEGFEPLPGGFAYTPFNDIEALERNLTDSVAAFIVEPVQGESGVYPATREFLAAARRLCDERGALLVFDEIQCGMGRLGPLFAFEQFGIVPDVVTMAKALANGLPIGAMLVAETAATALQPGDHGTTFGGSLVPAAAALAHLRIRDRDDLARNVGERSRQFFERLARFNPRGSGLLIGIPVDPGTPVANVVTTLRERGVLAGSAGDNTLRLAPPLIISAAQVDEACEAIATVLDPSLAVR